MQAETVFDPALPEFCLTVVPAAGPAECVRAIYRGQRGYCATTYRVESIEEGHRLVAHMMRIPMKPTTDSNLKPPTCSDRKPTTHSDGYRQG